MTATARKRRPRKQKPETKQNINLMDVIEQFGSEDKCREYLEELRWPEGVICPECGSQSISWISTRNQHDCNDCRHRFSVKSGTMLHDSHLPLVKWFITVYMMCESKKGVSANQVKRTIGVAYKTAWYLCHRIREAMTKVNEKSEQLDDTVEVDESFVGGKTKGMGHGYKGNKKAVAVAVERHGKVRLETIPNRERKTLHRFIQKHVKDADAIFTDDWEAYEGIAELLNTEHETVSHSKEEWVRGRVHTNTAEGVWSLLKRSIIGAFHQVSHKHLDRYLNELEWRFGQRHNPNLFRDILICLLEPGNMEYKELIKKSA